MAGYSGGGGGGGGVKLNCELRWESEEGAGGGRAWESKATGRVTVTNDSG